MKAPSDSCVLIRKDMMPFTPADIVRFCIDSGRYNIGCLRSGHSISYMCNQIDALENFLISTFEANRAIEAIHSYMPMYFNSDIEYGALDSYIQWNHITNMTERHKYIIGIKQKFWDSFMETYK